MSARSRSISPSTSIRSRSDSSHDSDCVDSGYANPRYAGLSEEELMTIWERRNLAYFDRRQRLLAEDEERERQQQEQQGGAVCGDESATAHCTDLEETHVGVPLELSVPMSSAQSVQQQQQQQLAPPAGYICAADSPQWREMTSHNIMGDYDAERASRDPAYLYAWTSCQRLVNMNRSGATAAGNFIPTNPRLAALLEHRRREVARERHEEETARRQQQQQEGHSSSHRDQGAADRQGMDADGDAAVPAVPAAAAAQQAAAFQRLDQAHMLEQQRGGSVAYAQGNSSPKRSSSASESSGSEKSVSNSPKRSFFLALPYPTQQLIKSVKCTSCNCALYTAPVAMRFVCQTCGCVSFIPRDDEVRHEEKMQDAEDQDIDMSC